MKQFSKLLALAALMLPTLAFAGVDYGFTCVQVSGKVGGNSGQCNSIASQFNVNVSAGSSPYEASFKFTNNVGTASNISEIYFDFPSTLSVSGYQILESGGPDFSLGGSPSDLPGGNTVGFASDWMVSADNPSPQKGINASGESVTVNINFAGSPTLQSIYDAINNGSFRFGLHVQAIGTTGKSDAFVNGPPNVVPEPGTYGALAGVAIAALAWTKRRKS